MIELIAHWQVKPGHEAETKAALDDMFDVVVSCQPGVLLYIVSHSLDETEGFTTMPPRPPREVVFWETYADKEVFDEHVAWQKAYMKEKGYTEYFVMPAGAELPTFAVQFLDRKKAMIRDDYPS